jgi:hypothetical protein
MSLSLRKFGPMVDDVGDMVTQPAFALLEKYICLLIQAMLQESRPLHTIKGQNQQRTNLTTLAGKASKPNPEHVAWKIWGSFGMKHVQLWLVWFSCLAVAFYASVSSGENHVRADPIQTPRVGERVGLLAMGVYWKGLFRDAEIMAWGKPLKKSFPSASAHRICST